jgi:hypothetical protein
MGNDEFILYVRKKGRGANKTTRQLGREIWQRIKAYDPEAKQIEKDQDSHWGKQGEHVSPSDLPKTSTQFEFDSSILPKLYEFLDKEI